MHRRQLGLVIYRIGTDLIAKAAFFLVTVAAARALSQQAFGLFSLATTVGWMVAVAADFGMQMHLARAVAQDRAAAPHIFARWLPVRVLTAFTGTVAVAIGASAFLPPESAPSTLVLFTAIYTVNGLTEFICYFYRALDRSDLESSLMLGQRLLMLALALLTLRVAPRVNPLGIAMLLPAVITFTVAVPLARRLGRTAASAAEFAPRTGEHLPAGEMKPTATPARAHEITRSVLPIGTAVVLSALYFRIDVFLIETWRGIEAVGLYNAVFRIVDAIRLLPAAVLAVALPTLFTADTTRPLARLATMMTGGAILVTTALWWTADLAIPRLYGSPYAAASQAFKVLTLSFPLMTLNYALTHQLLGWHGQRFYAAVCAVALLFNIAVNLSLIPAFGIIGAAWSTLLTEGIVTVGCAIGLRPARRLRVQALPTPFVAVTR